MAGVAARQHDLEKALRHVERLVVVRREVPAHDIVDITVLVVVNPVCRDLFGVAPHVGDEILVVVVDARVGDGDDDPLAAIGLVPRAIGADFEHAPRAG